MGIGLLLCLQIFRHLLGGSFRFTLRNKFPVAFYDPRNARASRHVQAAVSPFANPLVPVFASFDCYRHVSAFSEPRRDVWFRALLMVVVVGLTLPVYPKV